MGAAIETDRFGTTHDGVPVDRFTLAAGKVRIRLITFGATLTELWTPDRHGRDDDIVLGFDRLAQYESHTNPYFGCIVGRVAFRITESRFVLEGRTHTLTQNCGQHHLHGGVKGLSRVVWRAEPAEGPDRVSVRFTHRSPDGDQGYPGELAVAVVYTLTDRGEMTIDYSAATDRPTPVNLTHHGYFNLAGAGSGDVRNHVLTLAADRYSVTDATIAPTGELAPVAGTPYDFTRPTPVGSRFAKIPGPATGYDLAYFLARPGGSLAHVATMHEPETGRTLRIDTTAGALIFYTGDYLDGTLTGKSGTVYARHAGFCLEPGHLPDAVNQPTFPTSILHPGEEYRHTSVYRFSCT